MECPRNLISGVFTLMVALLIVGPVAASVGGLELTSGQGQDLVDPCRTPPRTSAPEVRARCTLDEVPDPRVGTSFTASVFLGVCEQGEPDDQCDIRFSQTVPRTGGEARADLYTLAVEMNDPTTVCAPFIGCHTVYKPSGRFRATVFNADGAAEAEAWAPTGSNAAADPGEVCVRNGGYGAPCTGQTGNEDISVSGSPTGWVVVNP